MKALALSALAVAVAALVIAILGLKRPQPTPAAPPEQLVLTDAAGHERIRIKVDDQGGLIVFLDAQGQPRATLREDYLVVSGADARAQLGASAQKTGLQIYNAAYMA